jgi:biopolymer transport protein TolR
MGFSGGKKKGSLSEINVTPLVDVMLVLLVVFMVTTPMIVKPKEGKVELDLPETNTEPVSPDELQSVIKIDPSKTIYINMGQGDSTLLDGCPEYPACLKGFDEKLKANTILDPFREGQRLFLLADRSLPYGYVLDVMARFKNAGIKNLGLVTNPPGAAEERAKKAAKQ